MEIILWIFVIILTTVGFIWVLNDFLQASGDIACERYKPVVVMLHRKTIYLKYGGKVRLVAEGKCVT